MHFAMTQRNSHPQRTISLVFLTFYNTNGKARAMAYDILLFLRKSKDTSAWREFAVNGVNSKGKNHLAPSIIEITDQL